MTFATRSLLIVAAAAVASQGSAQTLVSPNDRALFEGSSSTSYPLGRHDGRFQQIHADVGTALQTISEHWYRRDAISERGDVPGFQAELEVVLSAAAVAPDAASRTFAQNHGPSPVAVLPRTLLSFPQTHRPGTDPAPAFEHRIPYSMPFVLPAGAPLCVDVTVHGNVTANGPDRNFSVELDAHELFTDGRAEQPGFISHPGCAALGSSATHDARFSFDRAPDGSLSLDIRSRDGVASTGTVPALTAIIVGFGAQPRTWPGNPSCQIVPSLDGTYTLPGANDPTGAWSGTLAGIPQIAPNTRFHVQLASGAIAANDLTFSSTSIVTVPPAGPAVLPVVRIASGSDRTATTGAISRTVTVTEFR